MPNRVRILTVPDDDRVKLERRARARGEPGRVAEPEAGLGGEPARAADRARMRSTGFWAR